MARYSRVALYQKAQNAAHNQLNKLKPTPFKKTIDPIPEAKHTEDPAEDSHKETNTMAPLPPVVKTGEKKSDKAKKSVSAKSSKKMPKKTVSASKKSTGKKMVKKSAVRTKSAVKSPAKKVASKAKPAKKMTAKKGASKKLSSSAKKRTSGSAKRSAQKKTK